MGQISRMNRADRFIQEFGDDIVATLSLRPGMQLQVKSVGLGCRSCSEDVVAYATLQDSDGLLEVEVELDDGVFFDPEYDDDDDIAEVLANLLRVDREKVLERLKKADLS